MLVACWFAFATWVERAGIYAPPDLPDDPVLSLPATTEPGGVSRCGDAWLHREQGIGELYLAGGPLARGHAMAALCRDDLAAQEDVLLHELDRLLPGDTRRYFVRKMLLFAFRELPEHMDRSYKLELAALAQELERQPRAGPLSEFPEYHRALFYQTLYDTGQAMAEAGIVEAELGCTSFAASGDLTESGRLLVARNCDFEAGDVFDERKLVQFVAPGDGHRFVAVSWAGMLGVVSGVNDQGLVVMLHAARTEETRWPRPGTPVPFVLRDALVHDRTIEEVAARFRATPVHAAAMVLVAESATGRSAVIETDPRWTVVMEEATGATVVANTLRSPQWSGDAVATASRRVGSSMLREARMRELLADADGPLGAPDAAVMLRDRAGLGGTEIGAGNRTAVSALNSAHSVVYDAAAGLLHVSKAPRGTGEFVAYDVGAFFAGATPRGPEDVRVPGASVAPDIDDGSAARIAEARLLLRSVDELRDAGDTAGALAAAQRADALMLSTPESLLAVAEALRDLDRPQEARDAAARGLARQPVPGPERARLGEISSDQD